MEANSGQTERKPSSLSYHEAVLDFGVLERVLEWQGGCLGVTPMGDKMIQPLIQAGLSRFWTDSNMGKEFLRRTSTESEVEESDYLAMIYERLKQGARDDQFCKFLDDNEEQVKSIVLEYGCSPELVFFSCALKVRQEIETLTERRLVELDHANGRCKVKLGAKET